MVFQGLQRLKHLNSVDIQTPGCEPDAAAKGAANWARGARRMSLGKKGAANRSVFAIKRRQMERLVETMRQILVTQSESQSNGRSCQKLGMKTCRFFTLQSHTTPPEQKKTWGENVSLRPLLPNVFPFDAKSCQSLPNLFLRVGVRIILQNCTVKNGFLWGLWITLACVIWHVFTWTTTT